MERYSGTYPNMSAKVWRYAEPDEQGVAAASGRGLVPFDGEGTFG
jgi:hypothetical protein